MKFSRLFESVKESRYIPPIWLAVLIANIFIYGGSVLGIVAMAPIDFIIVQFFQLLSPDGSRGSTMELYSHYNLFFQLGAFFFIALTVYFWVRLVERRPFFSLGFFKENWLKELGKGFLIGAIQFSLVVVLLLLTKTGSLRLAKLNLEPIFCMIALIPFWVLQGGTEELVTRGWLFPIVSVKSNVVIGIGISSLLFGVLHLFNSGITVLSIVNITLDGVFACLLLLKYENMWILAGMHGAWNFVQGNIYGMQVSGQETTTSIFNYISHSSVDWLSGGTFGAEGSIFTSLVLIACIAYLYWSLKREGKLS